MTKEQYIEKFGKPKTENTNCLEDIACPGCWNHDVFVVTASSEFHLLDDGTDDFGDVEFGDDSPIRCEECGHSGTVGEFRVRGLDSEEPEE